VARLADPLEEQLCSFVLIPQLKPALFFRTVPLVSRNMWERSCRVNVYFQAFELARLLKCQADQNAVAVGIQDELFIIVIHEPKQSSSAPEINRFSVLR